MVASRLIYPRVTLVSTYDLGRQPFGLASPAAWLREAGAQVTTIDLSREPFRPGAFDSDLVAFHLPMHTATRLAVPVIREVRALVPAAKLCSYGLYGPPNDALLRELGVEHVLGGEFEQALLGPAAAQKLRVTGESQRTAGCRVYGSQSGLQAPMPTLPNSAGVRWPVPGDSV